jgi:hypothetical protein
MLSSLIENISNTNDDNKYIDMFVDMITNKTYSLERIIRLICLYCIVNDGIDEEHCYTLNRKISQNFGTGNKYYLFMFENLLKCGIIYTNNIQYEGLWRKNRKALHLLVDYDIKVPNDIAYIFGGYAPISCRIVEYALQVGFKILAQQKIKNILFRGWKNKYIDNKLISIGTNFYVVQEYDFDKLTNEEYSNMESTILLYFVGGITYSEISALNFLMQMNADKGKHLIIATTKIINNNNFIKNLI